MDYSRQEALSEIGKDGQELLSKKTVAVVGVGAIGCAAASLVARSGIGKIKLIDRDIVEESNLHRQILYDKEDIGKAKSEAAKEKLMKAGNAEIEAIVADIDYKNIEILKADIILDCTDNLETRQLINEYCLKTNTSWVHSSVLRTIGTVISFFPGSACFRCIFRNSVALENCDTAGVMNTAVMAVAAMQVTECIKILLGEREQTIKRIDVWNGEILKLKAKKNERCMPCNGEYEYINGKKKTSAVLLCGTKSYQIKGGKADITLLRKDSKFKEIGQCLYSEKITIFPDGRAIVKAESESEARTIYSRVLG